MTEDSIKTGIYIINQYFDSMDKLVKDVDYFKSECIEAIKHKEDAVKIYGLAFNLAWSLRYTSKKMVEYLEYQKNTLLCDFWERNSNLVTKFNELSDDLESFIYKYLEVVITLNVPVYLDFKDEEYDKIKEYISDISYFDDLSKELISNGDRILNVIIFSLFHMKKLLIEIRNIRINRTEKELELLFENEFKDYLTSDTWNDLKNTFIDTTIALKFKGVEPTIEKLQEMRDDEYDRMQDLRRILGSFDAYLTDHSKLAGYIIRREIEHNVNNPVIELFSYLGRISLIDQWVNDINEETPLMEHSSQFDSLAPIIYSEKLSEKRLKQLWTKIEEIYNKRSTIDWVCFYHVLVYRNYISCDDFKYIAELINEYSHKEIFTSTNIRQIKMSYWVKEAKRMWTIQEYHKWRNSAKGDQVYREYELLCNAINELFK